MAFSMNTFHSDKWDVAFSNLPSIEDTRDLAMYDRFVKSIVIPDYNLAEILSYGPDGFMIRHPVGRRVNTDLSQIQIEFKLSEDMLNYLNLFEWIRRIKYHENIPENDFFRNYTIKGININIRDNQKRPIAIMTFTNCFLLSISSLSLETGNSEEITFSTNFSYEELKYDTESVLNC